MLFASISRPGLLEGTTGLAVDGVELRLDLFAKVDLPQVKELLKKSAHPLLLTLRGGSEEKIEQLLALEPPFFDLECTRPKAFIQQMMARYPKTKYILSFHGPMEDLESIWQAMIPHSAYGYKIASPVDSVNEALQMLLFSRKNPKVSVISMGEKGSFARILAPCLGGQLSYASIASHEKTAPGQLSAQELTEIYRHRSLDKNTELFGLIGNPVSFSQGHLHHNRVFKERGLNAVYVKIEVNPEELARFIPLAKEIGFRGLSVTMPLKEKIIPFVDAMDRDSQQVGAINTLLFQKNGQIRGTNTDGKGALDAIEKKRAVRGKKVVLLGAGGAARAIAFEAKKRGASLLILNRTKEKAEALADAFGGKGGGLSDLPEDADVLINATSQLMPIDSSKISPRSLVMDVLYRDVITPFLQAASRLGCPIVSGDEMFKNQAALQTAFWFGS